MQVYKREQQEELRIQERQSSSNGKDNRTKGENKYNLRHEEEKTKKKEEMMQMRKKR